MRACKDCEIEKSLDSFHKNGKWYRWRCKKCHNAKFQPATEKPNSGRFKKGHIPVAGFSKGHTPWNKGKNLCPEVIEKIAIAKRKTGKCIGSWNHNQWKKAVLKRDNYKCQECFSSEQLCAHHLRPWRDFPELRFEISNGITFCKSCHARLHGKEMCNILKNGLPAHAYKKGHVPWIKGKKMSHEHRKKLSEAHKVSVHGNITIV